MNSKIFECSYQRTREYFSKVRPRRIRLLAVLMPLFIVLTYRLFVETDRYASETQIVVMSSKSSSHENLGLGLLAGSGANYQDAKLVQEFIYSLDMLKYLQSSIKILDHYRSPRIDFLSTLSARLTIDECLDYFKDKVHVKFDETSGIISIETESFAPEYSALIAKTIVDRSEAFINQIDNGLARHRLEFVEKELKDSHRKMRESKQTLVDFAAKYGLVQPEEQSKSLVAVVNELNAELTRQEAELKNLLSFMNPLSPDVVALKAKIKALKDQIRGEHGQFAANGEQSLAKLTAQHHDLILNFSFAQDAYKATLTAWERARIDSFQKNKYLVKVTQPDQAQYAKYPNRLRNVLSALLVISIIYGIAVLVLEISREHRA